MIQATRVAYRYTLYVHLWLLLLLQLPVLHPKMTLRFAGLPLHGSHAGSTRTGTGRNRLPNTGRSGTIAGAEGHARFVCCY